MQSMFSRVAAGPQVLAEALTHDFDALSPDELVQWNRLATEIVRTAQALALKALAAADRKNAHRSTGATDLKALVANQAGVTRVEAGKQIRLAHQLGSAPQVNAALAKPGMSTQKASIVTEALENLPPDLDRAQRDRVEHDLTEAAQVMSAEQLRLKARRAIESIDVKRADEIENATLKRDEADQRQGRVFWIGRPDEKTGLVSFGGKTDAVTADMLRAVLDSKTSPRRQARLESERTGATVTSVEDDRHLTHQQKAGEAFAEIVRHLPRDSYGNHGGVAATLVVTVSEPTLRGETDRAGVTEFGTPVSAGQLRRLACGAGILPAVMNGQSQVLDQGRTKRHHTAAQRVALAQRDQGCAYPGCDRPPGWTEAHHAIPWSQSGETNLGTGVLLCSHHHHVVHDARILVRFTDGMPEFLIKTAWRRNHRYRPLAA